MIAFYDSATNQHVSVSVPDNFATEFFGDALNDPQIVEAFIRDIREMMNRRLDKSNFAYHVQTKQCNVCMETKREFVDCENGCSFQTCMDWFERLDAAYGCNQPHCPQCRGHFKLMEEEEPCDCPMCNPERDFDEYEAIADDFDHPLDTTLSQEPEVQVRRQYNLRPRRQINYKE